MTEKYAKILYNWLSQFGTTIRGVLPANATEPSGVFLTYDVVAGNFGENFMQAVSIYEIGATNYENIWTVVDDIENTIRECGVIIRNSDMNITIYKGSPFYQDIGSGNDTAKAGYINLQVKIYQKNN